MANKIILKKTSTASKVPLSTDLEVGEIAVNLADQKLYSKNASGTVILVGDGQGTGDVVGGSSSTDNALARYDGTTGKVIQNSVVTVSDTGAIAGAESISNLDFAQFDTTVTPVEAVAKLQWDDGNGTLQLGLKGGNVNLQVGQEIVARVYNDSGVALTDGQIVYISGAQGNRVAVKLALATTDGTSAGTLGMVTEPIAIGGEGFITILGTVNGLNTTGLTEGAIIYLSPTVAGAYTTTKPVAPQHTVTLGYVERVHATVGSIYVKVDNGYELDELHNVLITSPTSGNTLIYDAVQEVWENANITAGTGVSVTNGAGSITIANTGVTSLTGTTNEIDVSASTGGITISLPSTINANTTGTADNVSGVVAIANGGTGQTTANASLNALLPSQTGNSGKVLSTDGTNTTWSSAGSGSGTVTSVSGTGTASGLTLSGTVTTSGSLTLSGTVNSLASGTYGISISGNSSTATNLSTDRTNWSSNGTISAVVGQLAWKNFGNNHTIFDASQSTTPSGTSCNNTNPQEGWTASYPTLMGWNGSTTYGVRVQRANQADYLAGTWDSSGRNYSREWIEMPNYSGLYSPLNSAHFYPNNGSYGSWRCDGSRNGWKGIEFDGQQTLMMNDGAVGVHRNIGGGWRYYVEGTNFYISGLVQAYWSDRRLKENLIPIKNESLDILSKLTAYRFNWNSKVKELDLPIAVGKEEIGLIAQEVQAILPDAVSVNKSLNKINDDGTQADYDYLTINYDRITPLLVEAVNILKTEIESLKAEIANLKGTK